MIKALSTNECIKLKEEFWEWFENGEGSGKGFLTNWINKINRSPYFRKNVIEKICDHYNIGGQKKVKYKKALKKLILADFEVMRELIGLLGCEKSEKKYLLGQYEGFRESKFVKTKFFKYFPTCPYCNFTYLPRLTEDYFGLQIDHHFSKSEYPYLAVSIFNLVPCCTVCNHIKKEKDIRIIYPYTEEFGNNAKFKYKISSLMEKDNYLKEVEIDLKDSSLKEKIQNSIDTFQLENKYNGLSTEAEEIYFKHLASSSSQVDELLENFKELGFDKNKIKEIYYGITFNKDNHIKRPISKFINDLIEDLESKS